MTEEKNNISMGKSAMYPAFTLNEIIETFIKKIDSLGGKKVKVETVASAFGVSPSTKSFSKKLSAAKQYGLITLSKGLIELTDLANNILYPTSSSINELLIEAFSKPPIYEKLIDRFNGRILPNSIMLSNLLLDSEFSITKSVKDLVAEKFLENCKDLDLLNNGMFELNNKQDSELTINKDLGKINNSELDTLNNPDFKNSCYQEMSIPIPGKNEIIKILIPNNCDSNDYEFLKKYVEAVLPMYIDNIKK